MPKIPQKTTTPSRPPKLHNRTSGVINKRGTYTIKTNEPEPRLTQAVAKHRIAPALASLVVPIDTLTLDPENARVHGERNLEAIKQSLIEFGQVKPIVVRAATGVVVAGNGTMRCAQELGWPDIAACVVEMTELEAAGYGLADNRTAELASWDFAIVARLDAKLNAAGHTTIGWNTDELEVLRAADWTPPPIADDSTVSGAEGDPLLVNFTPDDYRPVSQALHEMGWSKESEIGQASVLSLICDEWLKYKNTYGPLTNATNPTEEAPAEDATADGDAAT